MQETETRRDGETEWNPRARERKAVVFHVRDTVDEGRSMATVKRYQDLIAWQKGMALCKLAYQVCARLPDTERFGLTSQIKRASISVPANIAEGFGRESRPDLIRFLRVARGSLFELGTLLTLAEELGYLHEAAPVPDLLAETDRVLQALIRSLEPLNRPQEVT